MESWIVPKLVPLGTTGSARNTDPGTASTDDDGFGGCVPVSP